ncbi:hypothetical protein PO909_025624 [Leuciscus waleckii]
MTDSVHNVWHQEANKSIQDWLREMSIRNQSQTLPHAGRCSVSMSVLFSCCPFSDDLESRDNTWEHSICT